MVGCQHCLAHGVVSKDARSRIHKRGGTVDQSTGMVVPAKNGVPRSSPIRLSEHFVLLKFNVISHDEVGSPGQLVGQGTMSHTGIGLVEFSVIKVPAGFVGLSGMIGGFGESPG